MSDYLFDKQGETDPEVARLEQLLGGHAHREPLRAPVERPARSVARRRWTMAAATTVLAVAATVAFVFTRPDPEPTPMEAAAVVCGPDGPGFAFATEGGEVRCAGAAAGSGVLPIGEWLETSAEVSARLEIADIGDLTVHGGSRVRLVGTGSDEHRLELAEGRVSALVVAPPRLFVVDTPGASAVDLGCAYELAVDGEGRTHLQVTAGAVSLEGHGLVAYVAAGNEVVAVRERGPGTPIAIDATKPLRDAVARFDAGDPAALDELLAVADQRDSFTLWNLLGRTEGEARSAVYRRLDSIHPHPESVPERDILDGQPAALEAWRDSFE
jgi:ferric-dicitrate binding protein FerR (iron transport regulator)